MKKILATIFFIFIWCETSNAENQQICDWIVDEVYTDLLNQGSNDHLFVVVGNDGRCEYGRGTEKQDGFNDCEKHRKEKGINGECKLFAIGKKKFIENKTALKTGCIKGNCVNGKGTFIWPNGDKYNGNWKNQKPHGLGTFKWVNGTKYIGDWELGIQNGQGTVTWANGDKYIGGRKNGQADGQGTFIYANGITQSGEWKNGNLIERSSSGTAIGCVEGNCDNGKGTGVWEKGFKYVGEWKMQNMHGFGIGTWPNGDRYEGDWVNGQRTGQGKYFYSSGGGVYTGEWKNNNRHGEGTMIWNDGVKQVAIWEMDKPVKTISLSKNFIFKGGSEWKDGDIINKKDPSNFINLSFVEKKKVLGYDKRTLSNKYTKDGWGKSSFTVFVFNASFENSKDILINVNDEFKTNKKAKKQAIKWAKIYGQMPKFLKKNVKEIFIHKGKVGWAGGQGTIVIHTDYLTNENKKYAEELMFHELTHASLDWWWGGSVNEEKWLNAVSTDKYYISEYAWKLPGNEDLAETVLWWYASRCKVDRISKKNNEKVNKFLTNRFKYLDEQNYDTHPSNCIN
ncbi:hypothetical protein OAZ25_01065 [Candidatus Pelagibacter sp.]|nr:hypothetical protein [Candidatus Pelagibacter sp.]